LEALTNSPATLQQVQRWLESCRESHTKCRAQGLDTMPTRLIEICPSSIRLNHTRKFSERPAYLTLSHCWGGLNLFNLTTDSLEQMQEQIPFERLCQTFQDAIHITRQLGFKYIWIDSLCIIQDNDEDWRQEASRMASVYGFSTLNIAAASAKNGTFGCFSHRSEHVLQYMRGVQVDLTGHGPYTIHDMSQYYESSVLKGPLAQRPWVLQERILSPRIIWFSNRGIFWECREKMASETFPDHIPDFYRRMELGDRDVEKLASRWSSLVQKYTKGKLTFPGDKLIAISGLATMVQQQTQDMYTWGLWRRGFEVQLCWSVINSKESSYAGPIHIRAPSWSWASIDGTIDFPNDLRLSTLIRTVDVTVAPAGTFPLKDPGSRILRIISGPLVEATEVSMGDNRAPGVIWSGSLIRGSWVSQWDTPVVNSNEPRDQFYCLPILQFRGIIGLMVKKTSDGIKGRFRRIGMFKLYYAGPKVTDALRDTRLMANNDMYESLAGVDNFGISQYFVTLI